MQFRLRTLLIIAHLVAAIIACLWLGFGVTAAVVGVAVFFAAQALASRFVTSDFVNKC